MLLNVLAACVEFKQLWSSVAQRLFAKKALLHVLRHTVEQGMRIARSVAMSHVNVGRKVLPQTSPSSQGHAAMCFPTRMNNTRCDLAERLTCNTTCRTNNLNAECGGIGRTHCEYPSRLHQTCRKEGTFKMQCARVWLYRTELL